MIRPRRLAAGDRVALVSPASPVEDERIERAIARCRRLGFEPVPGGAVRRRVGYLAGDDAERAADLQRALDDARIAAIWPLRGGYGVMRILPWLDFSALVERPKAVIGFSDNTALHLALRKRGLVSFHGPHAGAAEFPEAAEASFRRTLCEAAPAGRVPCPDGAAEPLRGGRAEGALAGGNLALLAATCGTPCQLDARGAILVIEDVAEPVYRIDRMLTQLAQAGVARGIAGVAFGRFTRIPRQEHDRPLRDVLLEWVRMLDVPAVAGLPIGHIDACCTLPLGVRARLDADAGTLDVLEPAVE